MVGRQRGENGGEGHFDLFSCGAEPKQAGPVPIWQGTSPGTNTWRSTPYRRREKISRGTVGLDILLIDDEPEIRLVLEEALRDADHRVVVSGDGLEALNHALSKVFDVIICDVRLPQMDGLTLFRRIRQESPTTEVILMTAYGDVTDAVAALKQGAFDYLTKPFDVDELLLQLKRISEHRALRAELEQARVQLSGRKRE